MGSCCPCHIDQNENKHIVLNLSPVQCRFHVLSCVVVSLSLIDVSLGILVAKAIYALIHDLGSSVISDFVKAKVDTRRRHLPCFETHERTEQYRQDHMCFHP